jgi:hypothetical protein
MGVLRRILGILGLLSGYYVRGYGVGEVRERLGGGGDVGGLSREGPRIRS